MEKGKFKEILNEIQKERNLPGSINIAKHIIEHLYKRGNLILENQNGEKISSLAEYEDYFVDIIIKLSRCRQSII